MFPDVLASRYKPHDWMEGRHVCSWSGGIQVLIVFDICATFESCIFSVFVTLSYLYNKDALFHEAAYGVQV